MKRFSIVLLWSVFLIVSLACKAVTGGPEIESPGNSEHQATPDVLNRPPQTLPVPEGGTGSISGALSYPGEMIPPLRVVAMRLDSGRAYYVDTEKNQATYQITDLPAGLYHVVAYMAEKSLAGGYSQAVPCGLTVECNDHLLIDVEVVAGQERNQVDPADWYAPPGTFPSDPTR